jgi:hypothetical protein
VCEHLFEEKYGITSIHPKEDDLLKADFCTVARAKILDAFQISRFSFTVDRILNHPIMLELAEVSGWFEIDNVKSQRGKELFLIVVGLRLLLQSSDCT